MFRSLSVFLFLILFSSCIVLDSRSIRLATDEDEINRIILLEEIASKDLSVEERISILVGEMTLEEKISLLSGYKDFYIEPLERLGLRPLRSADATMGLRGIGRSTAMPAAIAMAATWDEKLVYDIGRVIAEECRAKGIDILLAPGVNIYRVPTNSRNFEYFGEDPYLAGVLATDYIKGIQDNGVLATVKHFAANNSEYDRHRMNSIVDERTLHEIYFPVFKMAIEKGNVLGVMMAYNPVNGISASENEYLMRDILRDTWGFKGVIMTDWISSYSTLDSIKAGLNLEMPTDTYFNEKAIKKLLTEGLIVEAEIDEMVGYILYPSFELGLYDRAPVDNSFVEFGGEHDEVALKTAIEGSVLLKNDKNLLPLKGEELKKVVIIGHNAVKTATTGGGAGNVKAHNPVSIVDGFKNALPNVEIMTSASSSQIKSADAVIVCIGFDSWHEQESHERPWRLPKSQINLVKKVAKLNPNTIVSITAGGGIETESWIGEVPAILHSFYGGQSIGTAVASLILGESNPSAKLPMTMAKYWEDFSTTAPDRYIRENQISWTIFPMINLKIPLFGSTVLRQIWDSEYKEGIMVGYRHFTTANVTPQFAFGHGLSYTSFEISDATLSASSINIGDSVTLTCKVTNTGDRAGAEVVQAYIRDVDSSVIRPDRELKGFKKVFLDAGESQTISIELDKDSFSFYDIEITDWVIEPGQFEVLVGNSSVDIDSTLPLTVN